MIIDGHAHAAGKFADADKLVEALDELGVDKVALCPGLRNNTRVGPLPNVPISAVKQHPLYSRCFIHPGIRFSYNFVFRDRGDGNEFVYSFVQRHPDRVVQVYWADPRKAGFMGKMESDFGKWHFKAIKLHQACTPFKIDSPEVDQIVEFAGSNRLPVFIHLWSGSEARRMIAVMKEHPDTSFVILHLIGIEVLVSHAGIFHNAHYDISPYSYLSEKRIRMAIDAFGAERIVFGSDTPFDGDSQRRVMERVRNMDLSDIQKEQILGGNLARILDL
jgi:predicted TIM-barrel fold metal-dependent hydrolase